MDRLPVIELTIDDLEMDRVEAIAFVDNPAIQVDWMAFNEHKDKFRFETTDTEKKIVAGPLMIPDMDIYRNMDGKEFFVRFSAKTIEDIVNKFMKEGKINAFNFMHDEKQPINDVYIQQSFIINRENGINPPKNFEHLPDGTWFGYVKVDNDTIWNDFVKTGKLKGFSVEGSFSEKAKFGKQEIETDNELDNFIMDIKAKFKEFSKKYFDSAEATAAANAKVTPDATASVQLGEAILADGTKLVVEGEIKEGVAIKMEDGSPAPDGEHTLQDGTVIAVSNGMIAMVKSAEEPDMNAEMAAEIEALKAKNAELESKLNDYAKNDSVANIEKSMNEKFKEMFSLIEEVSKLSTSEKDTQKFRHTSNGLNDKLAGLKSKIEFNKKK